MIVNVGRGSGFFFVAFAVEFATEQQSEHCAQNSGAGEVYGQEVAQGMDGQWFAGRATVLGQDQVSEETKQGQGQPAKK